MFCGLLPSVFAAVMLFTIQKENYRAGKKYTAAAVILQFNGVLSEFSIFPNVSTGLSLQPQIVSAPGISLKL